MESLNVDVPEQKLKIIYYININGPVVAQRIAKSMNLPSFLASALLSELLKDKLVKSSYLRVGGSPLYFVKGQEDKLDNFIKHLEMKEREAFAVLKEKELLEDIKLDPPIRVAFRIIKDFAVPLMISMDSGDRLFWKFHTLSKEDAEEKLKKILKDVKPKKLKLEDSTVEVKKNPQVQQDLQSNSQIENKEELSISKVKSTKPKIKKISKLPLKVQEWAQKEGVVLKEEIESGGKVFKSIVEVKSNIGSLDFLLIAFDKKCVNEGDLALCYHEGLDSKLPVLLLMNGKVSKKGQKILEGFKGHLTMRKL